MYIAKKTSEKKPSNFNHIILHHSQSWITSLNGHIWFFYFYNWTSWLYKL